jgi:hypothetical protein
MLKSIVISIFLFNFYVYSLKSNDICIKRVECNGKNCNLESCKGILSYECNRLECALNADSCDEYHEMVKYMNVKKQLKLDKVKTLELIRGVPFLTKTLRNFEVLRSGINLC